MGSMNMKYANSIFLENAKIRNYEADGVRLLPNNDSQSTTFCMKGLLCHLASNITIEVLCSSIILQGNVETSTFLEFRKQGDIFFFNFLFQQN